MEGVLLDHLPPEWPFHIRMDRRGPAELRTLLMRCQWPNWQNSGKAEFNWEMVAKWSPRTTIRWDGWCSQREGFFSMWRLRDSFLESWHQSHSSKPSSSKGVFLVSAKNAFVAVKRDNSVNTYSRISTVPRGSERSEWASPWMERASEASVAKRSAAERVSGVSGASERT